MTIAGSGLDSHRDALIEAGSAQKLDGLERLLFSTPSVVAASLPRHLRRQDGIYLTSREMSSLVAHRVKSDLLDGATILDPSFGCGDLLLACAAHLPLGRTVSETVAQWSRIIQGYELSNEFVIIAKIRLALFAKLRHRTSQDIRSLIGDAFPHLMTGDFVETSHDPSALSAQSATCFVMNPPFTRLNLPTIAAWGSGKKSSAALFLHTVCDLAPSQSHIVGILPEVLRCGTSYSRLREILSESSREVYSRGLGRFSPDVDVDVFLLHLQKTGTSYVPESAGIAEAATLSTLADIAVGTVVPHRDPHKGPWCKYITVQDVPPWATTCHPEKSRRYWGRVFDPPFVVVRRTSSPDQRHRAIASVIVGNAPVAVENHLIVLAPRDRSISTCHRLQAILLSQQTDDDLNATMRCRHLTVSSLAGLKL